MRMIRRMKKLPIGEKIVKSFKVKSKDEVPDVVRECVCKYVSCFPKYDELTFHLTNEGNIVVEGLDLQEYDYILKMAYRNYSSRVLHENRHESFNGVCYATYEEFVSDCKEEPRYIQRLLDPKEFRRYLQVLKGGEVVTA